MAGMSLIIFGFFSILFAFNSVRYISFSHEDIYVEKKFKGELKISILFYLFMVILSGFIFVVF